MLAALLHLLLLHALLLLLAALLHLLLLHALLLLLAALLHLLLHPLLLLLAALLIELLPAIEIGGTIEFGAGLTTIALEISAATGVRSSVEVRAALAALKVRTAFEAAMILPPLRRGYSLPALAFAEERAVAIVAAPIIVERKVDDREAEIIAIVIERHAPAIINGGKQIGVEPAAIIEKLDVAPIIAIQTAIDFDCLAAMEIDDRRVVRRRAGQNRRGFIDIGLIGLRGACRRQRQQSRAGREGKSHPPQASFFHRSQDRHCDLHPHHRTIIGGCSSIMQIWGKNGAQLWLFLVDVGATTVA